LHNLTSLLADTGQVRNTRKLSYSISDEPATAHDLLLQKSDGVFELVVWDERLKGAADVRINLGNAHASVKVYDPTIGTAPSQVLTRADAVSLTLSDRPVVIEITD
jgi:hypothetical protein